MLHARTSGEGPIAIFFLHWLGGAGRSWDEVAMRLEDRFRCVALDLPGFGGSASLAGYTVAEMANAVIEAVEQSRPEAWMLAGHSMGAKVAATVARAAEDGRPGLAGLKSIVLLAGSPPSPEPIAEDRRTAMLGWFRGSTEESRAQAVNYIRQNRKRELATGVEDAAVADVLAMRVAAWQAWLESGSREDWSERVGVLRTPALIVAGEKDVDLGGDAQRALMLPHFAQAHLRTVMGAGHLLPMEAPELIADCVAEASTLVRRPVPAGPSLPAEYRELIASDRVSAQTRALLLARAQPDDPAYQPRVLSPMELATLRAVAARVVPQDSSTRRSIDPAARIDQQLSEGNGNGWRYDLLPPDIEAYRTGIKTLDVEARMGGGFAFVTLNRNEQDNLLAKAAAGALGGGFLGHAAEALGMKASTGKDKVFNAEQMQRWFEEVRGDLVRIWVAHPATLAAMGYSGIADGADAETMQGFVQLGLGQREPWEPTATSGEQQ